MFLSAPPPPPPMPLGVLGDPSQGCTHRSPLSRVCRPRSLGVLGKDLGEELHRPFPGASRMGSGQEARVCPVQSLFLECLLVYPSPFAFLAYTRGWVAHAPGLSPALATMEP